MKTTKAKYQAALVLVVCAAIFFAYKHYSDKGTDVVAPEVK